MQQIMAELRSVDTDKVSVSSLRMTHRCDMWTTKRKNWPSVITFISVYCLLHVSAFAERHEAIKNT